MTSGLILLRPDMKNTALICVAAALLFALPNAENIVLKDGEDKSCKDFQKGRPRARPPGGL